LRARGVLVSSTSSRALIRSGGCCRVLVSRSAACCCSILIRGAGAAALLEAALLSCALGVVPAAGADDGLVLEALLDGVALLAEVSAGRRGSCCSGASRLALEALLCRSWLPPAAVGELAALWSLEAAGAAEDADLVDISFEAGRRARKSSRSTGWCCLVEVLLPKWLPRLHPNLKMQNPTRTYPRSSLHRSLLANCASGGRTSRLLEERCALLGSSADLTSVSQCACNLLVSPVSA